MKFIEEKFSVKLIKNDCSVFFQAITHRSIFGDDYEEGNSEVPKALERLEFLGDSLLKLITSVHVFCHNPKANPGILTDLRRPLISNVSFAELCHLLKLDQFLVIFGTPNPDSKIWSDLFEAFVAALYFHSGLQVMDSNGHCSC